MNILVIGNGFDLAHNLPTQYKDFLNFVKCFKNPDDSQYSQFISDIKDNKEDLYNEIRELVEDNILLDYFLGIYKKRCEEGKEGWIDFESEISLIVQGLDEKKRYIEEKFTKSVETVRANQKIIRSLNPIIKNFVEYLRNSDSQKQYNSSTPEFYDVLGNYLVDALNKMTHLLEIYLLEYVENIPCNTRLSDFDDKKIDYVLSFNYTNTYKNLYDIDGNAKYCFIHGKTMKGSTETCNLVLGIDEYLPLDRKDSDNQFVWFKKFYQRIYKETDSEYLDWIKRFEQNKVTDRNTLSDHMDIYIYGHSLDVTDKDVLSRLIMIEDSTTHIFYHSKEAMAKQISNLVKVIGQDNLIRKTGGTDRTIKFIHAKSPETSK